MCIYINVLLVSSIDNLNKILYDLIIFKSNSPNRIQDSLIIRLKPPKMLHYSPSKFSSDSSDSSSPIILDVAVLIADVAAPYASGDIIKAAIAANKISLDRKS